MTNAPIIDLPNLRQYLGDTAQAEPTDFLVRLVNGLVSEAWRVPVTPVPKSIELLTLEVAARACRNPRGLASWTRSVDDASRTERLPDTAAKAGVFLTDAERRVLRGRRRQWGTVRTPPGY